MWLLPGRELPAEAGELAGDRHGDDPVALATGVFELSPAGVQSSLRAPSDVDDLGGLIALAALERLPDAGLSLIVVSRLDQQPTGVGGAGLGDRALAAVLAGGVLRRDDPEVGRQLVGMPEPVKRADLGAQAKRGIDTSCACR